MSSEGGGWENTPKGTVLGTFLGRNFPKMKMKIYQKKCTKFSGKNHPKNPGEVQPVSSLFVLMAYFCSCSPPSPFAELLNFVLEYTKRWGVLGIPLPGIHFF